MDSTITFYQTEFEVNWKNLDPISLRHARGPASLLRSALFIIILFPSFLLNIKKKVFDVNIGTPICQNEFSSFQLQTPGKFKY